ncbi:efflux transporter outer membrane subunit [Commensalibacter oyaizuii]|uniref:Efflux transporter outer membrane subunit n=1 Tax=Commensalibacter oyaizuii TaxID=3043873 RepID=A0ABT6Q1B1_9PROT|nr:efflux transporter outer membrane subunit [Commensalibacter sp. TBRC 16381]MDI2090790.1 efflux transporter outer membrane subunit [Commensalibacter sp. TBRC 16381]
MNYKFSFLLLVIAAPIVTGCAVGPDYQKQDIWTPSKWSNTSNALQRNVNSQVVAQQVHPLWWECFHDPVLSALEKRLVTANLDVQMATQRLIASRAQLLIAGADRFPSLGASAGYQRSQYSEKSVSRAIQKVKNSHPALGNTINPSDIDVPSFNQWNDALDTSWELDLWGRVRRQYESAHALMQASEEDRRAILIAQQAELAQNYITLRGLQAELNIVQQNEKIAQESLTLAQQRFAGGLVTELDVRDAQSQLEQVRASIPTLEQQIIEYINALGLLLGEPPRALSNELIASQPIPPVPPQVPIGFPSELAQRRPDIREAEEKLHSATAEVGIAVADFYPKVTVDARMGFQSLSFRDLGFWSARAWSVGPTISLPIFEGGKLKGQLTLKKAQQKEAALFYRKTVLQAWQEVDNALNAYQAEQLKQVRLQDTVKANQRSVFLAQEQYRRGTQNFINVLDAERRLLASQKDLINSNAQISLNLVQLYKALGGGWESVYPAQSKSF